jgi:hypothetical protein
MDPHAMAPWGADWAWSLPLIILTTVLHAYGLGLLHKAVNSQASSRQQLRHPLFLSSFLIAGTALSVTVLHAIEGIIWALIYRLLGALADNKSAMLYSLNAMTSYGHENLNLAPHWQMMGALEAFNGWILFGLTTAFLFTVIQHAWPRTYAERPPSC